MHGRRLAIYDVVDAQPGIHFRAILRETGIPAGTAAHHLGILERLDYVQAREVGPRRCYVTRLQDVDALDERSFYLRHEPVQDVLQAVRDRPGARQCDYMAALPDMARSTVQHHLNRLAEMHVLEKWHRQGTTARYWLNGRDERR